MLQSSLGSEVWQAGSVFNDDKLALNVRNGMNLSCFIHIQHSIFQTLILRIFN